MFKLYEMVLNGHCCDGSLKKAKENPADFLVPGSMEFIKFLKERGIKNYFVTGAVVEKGIGIYREVESLGFKIGKDELIDDIYGSTCA